MTDINKQKFLAELGKLLTFMYEEDRLDALAVYEELFECCSDEQQLIHHLVSPTRQAVVLARAYNAKERMLSVQSQSRRDDLYGDFEEIPSFILAIENIKSEAPGLFQKSASADDSQFSLFAEAENYELPSPEPEYVSEVIEGQISMSLSEEAVDAPAEAESVTGDELAPIDDEPYIEVVEETVPALYVEKEEDEYDFAAPRVHQDAVIEDERLNELASKHRPRRENVSYKRVIPLLILYIILAVPITIFVVTLLLFPTIISLFLSLVFVITGVSALGCAFGSFAIFADILVVLGCALILLALGLLFFWLFIWFIGGAIAGFVNGVIKLGDKFSTKEVSA